MTMILPEVPSFGALLARNLGAGASKGLEQRQSSGSNDVANSLMKDIFKMNYEKMLKGKEEEKENQGLKQTLDWLEDQTKYVGQSWIPGQKSFVGIPGTPISRIGREAIEKREGIDSAGFWVTDKIYTHFNKGQMSEAKLDFIRQDIAPRSGLSEREYKSRVNALRRISNLPRDIPVGKLDKILEQEAKKVKGNSGSESNFQKVKSGTKLPNDMAQKILDQSGGDPEKARAAARKLGYEF